MNKRMIAAALVAASTLAGAQQPAPVAAHGAWARASVQGQQATGVFVTLVAREPLTLVGASSPAAAVTELHEMKLEGDVMRMRAVESLPLAAGQPVQLRPGGHHLMLQQLKAPLKPDTTIPVTLTFRTSAGEQRQLALQVPVSATPPRDAAAPASAAGHKH